MTRPDPGASAVVITHPDKLLFPADGITKGELAEYYQAIAPVMLPHVCGRPVTMERYPRGIGQDSFWQKDVSRGFPAWLERVQVPKKGGVVRHPLVCDARSLQWLANQNCVTVHVWPSRVPTLDKPDLLLIDLDPSDQENAGRNGGAAAERLCRAALLVRDSLAELGLTALVKTSGSKGFHVVVPLDATAEAAQVERFAHRLGAILVRRDPEHLTQEFLKADRGGRILVDTGRNGYSATFAAAYTVRARPGAPVSAPCRWDEVESGQVGPRTFSVRNMRARLDAVGDVWSQMTPQPLGPAIEKLRVSQQERRARS